MAGKIKFVKRGQSLAATVTEDDLAAHDWGSEVPSPVDKLRAQDLELPHEVNVVYINSGADYQQGTQKSERQTGSGVGVMTIPLPVVMSDTKAKQVADVNHYNAWVGRTTYTLQLSRKWSKLEPTDVIDVVYNAVTFRMRITKKDDSKPGIIKLECVAEDSAIYTQSGLGAGSSNIDTQTVTIPVQTLGMLLDIPMLRDADDNAGIYFAACGYSSGWGGCALFKSNDGGATYGQVTSTNDEAAIGYATTVLGDFYGGNIFDELNTVTVQMVAGTLSSISELLVLNGGNYAVLGDELIQFKTATLISANTYTLSGLLRGRRGTEWAMDSHTAGERFVLATVATWRRIPLQTSDIGLTRLFKFPTFGTTLQQTVAVPFTPAGVALECYSPVEVAAGRDTAGNITIKYLRRGRVSAEWRDYIDVPLGESTESYEIDVFSTSSFSAVVRTITTTSSTASYTAAQQITDFGYVLDILYIKVYQISAIVGRGVAAQVTINIPIPTTGYYSTNFSEYTIGVAPSDWTERWNTGNFSTTVESGGADRILKFAVTTAGRLALSWDDPGSFVNGEVLTKIKPFGRDSSGSGSNLARVFLRGNNTAGTESAYFASFDRDLNGVTIYKYVSGGGALLSNVSYPFALGNWQWVRFRATGSNLKLKVWLDGDVEPVDWTIITTDSAVTAAGWAGVGTLDAADDIEVDEFSVTIY